MIRYALVLAGRDIAAPTVQYDILDDTINDRRSSDKDRIR